MLVCKKCGGRIFVDSMYNAENHIEIFCINCGFRKFFHNWQPDDAEAKWFLAAEKMKAARTISPL